MTKQEVVAAILACAEKLGHAPSRGELVKQTQVTRGDLNRHFGTYAQALDECNLQRKGGNKKVAMEALFQDWTGIVRKLRKLPTQNEYEQFSRFSVRPLLGRFGVWRRVPQGMKHYAEEQGSAAEWRDVLELVEERARYHRDVPKSSVPLYVAKAMTDRPAYGALIGRWPLVFAPTNEAGVLYLLGALSERLGILALRIQTGYPDCEAMRVVENGNLQRVRIELEHQSRNFLYHMHDPKLCDLIVCWEHNWPECPLEVIELKSVVSNEPSAVDQTEEREGNCPNQKSTIPDI